ncbi:MAG: S8 family serine peptidase [Actinomycetota bacterium]
MRFKSFAAVLLTLMMLVGLPGTSGVLGAPSRTGSREVRDLRRITRPSEGYKPMFLRRSAAGRYIVTLEASSVAERLLKRQISSPSAQRTVTRSIESSQAPVIRATESLGGRVIYRYSRLINGLSVELGRGDALELARRSDVQSVEPVGRVDLENSTSVPFIGAPAVWNQHRARGKGMRIAIIDTGIDYTHKDFGGPGTVQAYEGNDPRVIEPGTFPTNKVVDGFDFVGEFFDPFDDSPENDLPRPDLDPLDQDGHGTHVAGTAAGNGVEETGIGPGVAPRAKILFYKVFSAGASTTTDVVVAGMDRAVDPNQDGSTNDHADVISMSLGSTYGDETSADGIASERATRLGAVVVAAAGNAGPVPYVHDGPSVAPSAIAVAAVIDQFNAQHVLVNEPAGVSLPNSGTAVHQDWSGPIDSDITGDVLDAREFDPPADPSGAPSPADQQLCTPVGGTPFEGSIALVFKGSTDEGDCDGTTKVFNAQQAGADAVILWSGFPGSPFVLAPGEFADQITIPAVMVDFSDGEALGATASPDAPDAYNTQTLNVTIEAEVSVVPGFEDRIADFSSHGPARITNDLKPDIAAPGVDISSAGVGTGNEGALISGTSMATPHIAGVVALLRQLHPRWSSERIKASIMNSAKRSVTDNATGEDLVPAAVAGAGRVRVDQSADATSVAFPGSLSFGLRQAPAPRTIKRSFTVHNYGNRRLDYSLQARNRYSDHDPGVADVSVSPARFSLNPGNKREVVATMTLDTSLISELEQEFGWVGLHGTMDGQIRVFQSGKGKQDNDKFNVVWGLVPQNASRTSVSPDELDLSSGSGTLAVNNDGTGLGHADGYLLGASDEIGSHGEEDLLLTGARSFTGATVDGTREGEPQGTEPLFGLSWIDFLTADSVPTEPVEFAAVTEAPHQTTDTVEVSVLIDAGADGVFADEEIGGDFLLVKQALGGTTCLFDLSDPNAIEEGECSATYFQDYGFFNSNLWGLVVDAQAIGLSDTQPELAYKIEACVSPVGEEIFCDSAGALNPDTGTYDSVIDVTDPALDFDPKVCGGFFGEPTCDSITVTTGNNLADGDPQALVLFPNNREQQSHQIVPTSGAGT